MSVRLHRWLGLALGLFVLLSAVSGTALAWRDHVWRLQHPSLAAPASQMSDAELAAGVRTLLTRHAVGSVRLMAPPKDDLAGWRLWLEDGDQALYSADATRQLTRWNESTSFFGMMLELHVYLFAGAPGRWLMGAVGVGAVMLTGFGLWAWLAAPRRLRARHLAPNAWRRGPWLLAHRQWGLLVTVPTLMLMLTGTLMNWSTLWRSALPPAQVLATGPPRASSDSGDLATAMATIRSQWPEARLAFLNVAEMHTGRLSARLRQPGEVHPNGRSAVTVSLDGTVLERYDALGAGALGALDDLVYPLHSGRIDIPGWHLGVVVSGLLLALLGCSGFATWAAAGRGAAVRRRQAGTPTAASPVPATERRVTASGLRNQG